MNKKQYEEIQKQDIGEATKIFLSLLPDVPWDSNNLDSVLETLSRRSARNTITYEVANLHDCAKLMALWNVNRQRVGAHCRMLNKRYGIGVKLGSSWVLTADEAVKHRPAARAGAPIGNKNNPYGNRRKPKA